MCIGCDATHFANRQSVSACCTCGYGQQEWLTTTCREKGWSHQRSPIVWRELVDRGGKALLVGGANELQEYALGYYGVKSAYGTDDLLLVSAENMATKRTTDDEERALQQSSTPLHVCVTDATSGAAYSLISGISRGDIFGYDEEVALHLCHRDDALATSRARGLVMETVDLAYPLLRSVITTADVREAFADCSVIILLDDVERETDEEHGDWLRRNHALFAGYADVIAEVARADVRVIVAGSGPINFNAYVLAHDAPVARRHNVVAVSRLVENRAKGVLATRLNVNSALVDNVIVWGNVGGWRFIDTSMARVHHYDGAVWGPPTFTLPLDETLHDNAWLRKEFPVELANRCAVEEGLLAHKATMATSAAIAKTVDHWWSGSSHGQIFSLAVPSEGDASLTLPYADRLARPHLRCSIR